jgi:hypothetical protein
VTQVDALIRQLRDGMEADDEMQQRAADAAREVLRAAVASESTRTRWTVSTRHRRRLALIGGLAAAIAVLLALIPSGSSNKQLGVQYASARVVLERAARAIARQPWHPLKPGEWLYFRYLQGIPPHDGPAPRHANGTQDSWVAVDGTARLVQRGMGPLGGQVLLTRATAGGRLAEQRRQRDGSRLPVMAYRRPYRWGAETPLDYRQLLHLPTDPRRLRRWIEREARHGGSTTRSSRIYSTAEALVTRSPLPPPLSAALYRVIARLPEMRVIGPTRDPLGRRGVAVAFLGGLGGGREELVFDRKTGAYLATRDISPSGTVDTWAAVENQAVVHSDHELPGVG